MKERKILFGLLIILLLSGCRINTKITECAWQYTDLDNNVGIFANCYVKPFGNGMYCASGDYRYIVQVKEYHQICWERDV